MIRLSVMMYIRYPLSLRQVEDLLFERGIDICHETVRFWWNRFGPMFAAEIRKRRIQTTPLKGLRKTRLLSAMCASTVRVLLFLNSHDGACIRALRPSSYK